VDARSSFQRALNPCRANNRRSAPSACQAPCRKFRRELEMVWGRPPRRPRERKDTEGRGACQPFSPESFVLFRHQEHESAAKVTVCSTCALDAGDVPSVSRSLPAAGSSGPPSNITGRDGAAMPSHPRRSPSLPPSPALFLPLVMTPPPLRPPSLSLPQSLSRSLALTPLWVPPSAVGTRHRSPSANAARPLLSP